MRAGVSVNDLNGALARIGSLKRRYLALREYTTYRGSDLGLLTKMVKAALDVVLNRQQSVHLARKTLAKWDNAHPERQQPEGTVVSWDSD